jgi:hypothetical protein
MVAWLPGMRALYTSDLIQRDSRPSATQTYFQPSMLMEVRDAAAREGITGIEKVFGMHLAPTPWTDVIDAIRKAMP